MNAADSGLIVDIEFLLARKPLSDELRSGEVSALVFASPQCEKSLNMTSPTLVCFTFYID